MRCLLLWRSEQQGDCVDWGGVSSGDFGGKGMSVVVIIITVLVIVVVTGSWCTV